MYSVLHACPPEEGSQDPLWWLGIELRTLGKDSHLSSLYIINLIRRGAGEVAQQLRTPGVL